MRQEDLDGRRRAQGQQEEEAGGRARGVGAPGRLHDRDDGKQSECLPANRRADLRYLDRPASGAPVPSSSMPHHHPTLESDALEPHGRASGVGNHRPSVMPPEHVSRRGSSGSGGGPHDGREWVGQGRAGRGGEGKELALRASPGSRLAVHMPEAGPPRGKHVRALPERQASGLLPRMAGHTKKLSEIPFSVSDPPWGGGAEKSSARSALPRALVRCDRCLRS